MNRVLLIRTDKSHGGKFVSLLKITSFEENDIHDNSRIEQFPATFFQENVFENRNLLFCINGKKY